jgi:hypothetical protein
MGERVLARLRPLVDHTIIDVCAVDGHDVVVMRDASRDLLPPRVPISRATSRALLAGLATIDDACEGESGEGLCPIGARYAMFAPAFHAPGSVSGAHPLADRIVQGWDLFEQHIDHDIAAAVFAVHHDPARLGRRLARFSPTLLHGDAKLENLGLNPDGLVAIDWGDLTGLGPREVDVAWFALKGAARIGCPPGRDIRRLRGGGGSTHGTRSARPRVHRLAGADGIPLRRQRVRFRAGHPQGRRGAADMVDRTGERCARSTRLDLNRAQLDYSGM